MEIGLALPRDGEAAALPRRARRAEDLGFGSVWMGDGPGGADPVVAIAALSRVTSGVRLGALPLAAGRRPPGVLAKALASVDRLAGGRLVVGLGPDGAGGEALAEALQVLKGLLAAGGEPFTFEGRHHCVHDARCRPGPHQRPHPPIWVVGHDDAVIDVAARWGDGWVVTGDWTPEDYGGRLAVLREACGRRERDPAELALAVALAPAAAPRPEAWAALGVGTCILDPRPAGAGSWDAGVETLARAVR